MARLHHVHALVCAEISCCATSPSCASGAPHGSTPSFTHADEFELRVLELQCLNTYCVRFFEYCGCMNCAVCENVYRE
eukprot:12478638-Prorocentrum_lima.AAC.1